MSCYFKLALSSIFPELSLWEKREWVNLAIVNAWHLIYELPYCTDSVKLLFL